MKKFKLLIVLFFVVGAVGGLYWYINDRGHSEPSIDSVEVLKAQTKPTVSEINSEKNDSSQVAESTMTEEKKIEQLTKYVQDEAKSLDNPHVQTQEKQNQLLERAAKLDDAEKNLLKTLVLNAARPINERILSVYLLSLTPGNLSQEIAADIAQAPLPDFGPSNPHTEAEIRNAQELAVRYMAIDKFVNDFKANPPQSEVARNALNSLELQSAENPIPQVRKYAGEQLSKLMR